MSKQHGSHGEFQSKFSSFRSVYTVRLNQVMIDQAYKEKNLFN